jgi:hypothetical protein
VQLNTYSGVRFFKWNRMKLTCVLNFDYRCEAYRTVQVEAEMGEVKQTKQMAAECEKRAAEAISEGDRQQLLQIRDRLKHGDQPTMPRAAKLETARLA